MDCIYQLLGERIRCFNIGVNLRTRNCVVDYTDIYTYDSTEIQECSLRQAELCSINRIASDPFYQYIATIAYFASRFWEPGGWKIICGGRQVDPTLEAFPGKHGEFLAIWLRSIVGTVEEQLVIRWGREKNLDTAKYKVGEFGVSVGKHVAKNKKNSLKFESDDLFYFQYVGLVYYTKQARAVVMTNEPKSLFTGTRFIP